MPDIATLGLAVDATQVDAGAKSLDNLTAAGERAEAKAKNVNASFQQTATAARAQSDAYVQTSNEVQKLLARYDPLGTKLRSLQADFALLNKAATNGGINAGDDKAVDMTYKRLNDEIDKTKALMVQAGAMGSENFGKIAEGADKSAFATAGARRELIVLGHEALTGNFSRMPGSFLVLGERIGATATATLGYGLAIGAVAVGIGYLLAKTEEYDRELGSLNRQFTASGQSAFYTTTQINSLIETLDKLPGVSKTAAIGAVEAFTKLPQIPSNIASKLLGLSNDFAAGSGAKDIAAAAKELAGAFADPANGAKKLDEQFNLLTADQIILIDKLERQGKTLEAQNVLLDAVTKRFQGLSRDGVTPLQKAASDLGSAWDHVVDSFGKTGGLENALSILAKIVDKAAYLVDHKNVLTAFAISPVFGAIANQFASDDTEGPSQSGKIGKASSSGTGTGDTAFQIQLKKDIELAKGKQSQLEKLRDEQTRYQNDLKELNQSGQSNSAAYEVIYKALGDVNKQIADIQKNLGAEQHNMLVARLEGELKIKEEQTKSASAQTESLLKLGVISETQAIQRHRDEDISLLNAKKLEEQKLLALARTPAERQKAENDIAVTNLQIEARAQKAVNDVLQRNDELRQERTADFLKEEARVALLNDVTKAYIGTLNNLLETRKAALDDAVLAIGIGDKEIEQNRRLQAVLKDYDTKLSELNKQYNSGHISQQQYDQELAALKDYQQKRIALEKEADDKITAAQADFYNGANRALQNYSDSVDNVAKSIEQVFTKAFSGLEDVLVNFVTTGKLNFTDLANSIIADIVRIQIQQSITGPLSKALSSGLSGGGFDGFIGSLLGNSGSSIPALDTSAVDAGSVLGSFASGTDFIQKDGLAFVHRGEKILNSAQNSSSGNQSGGVNVTNNFTINGQATTDIQMQIAARVASTLQRANIRNN